MATHQFVGMITRNGTRVCIELPFDPNQAWGVKTRHFVSGTVNNCTIRGALEADQGSYVLVLGPAWQRDTGLTVGEEVIVMLSPEGPQASHMAADIAAAFEHAPDAQAFFDGLPTFYRKNYTRWIDSAKRPETRAKRIAEMIELLKAGQRQR